jgi:hypothetical protein
MIRPVDVRTLDGVRESMAKSNSWLSVSYQELLPTGCTLVSRQMVGDYQGDWLFLLRDVEQGMYALLVVGYGSCSGCDVLESITDGWRDDRENTLDELQRLADRLCEEAIWMDPAEMRQHLEARDGANSWWRNDRGGEEAQECLIQDLLLAAGDK